MSSPIVIVFGPTGDVGSFTAIRAGDLGAKVWLAMRDISKAIPGLSSEDEKSRGYERVQADLTQPETVATAVKKSGAKRAFIYLAHGMSDHMKATLEALKASGIELVVFLSSYTIVGPPKDVPQEEIIPWMHAGVEVNLETIFGPQGYVAVRPGGFASNAPHWFSQGIKTGELGLYAEDVKFDWTTADDMGGVAGTVLAKGRQHDQKIVYVFGPQYISIREAWSIVQKEALNKEIKLTKINEEQYSQQLASAGMPPPISKYITSMMTRMSEKEERQFAHLEEGQKNVEKYLGRPGVSFSDWVSKHKTDFDL